MKSSLKKLIGCFLLVLVLLAFNQKDNDPLEEIVNALHQWTDSLPQEKVYLHMDKPYYALTDTIWFKAYITTGSRHQLSAISGAIYVDLIDQQDSLINSLKLPVSAGMSMGNFTLPDELKEGNYRIRAYTQWMRNSGVDYFFEHTFIVVNPFGNGVIANADELSNNTKVEKKLPSKTIMSEGDIQFFPESGNLIYGVASRLAFKAVGTDGNGSPVKGEIIDQDQQHITDFTSTFGGMGSFLMRPETGKTYIAKLTFSDGSIKSVSLPKPLISGYVLSVFQPNPDSLLVRINVPEQMVISQSALKVNCIVHAGGEVIVATPLKINKTITSFWLKKEAFPSGIAQFTLFSTEGEALVERVAFIKNKDYLLLTLKTPKENYNSREIVELHLDAKDLQNQPSIGNFSIAVTDDSNMPFDDIVASTICSNLLLTSDIKG